MEAYNVQELTRIIENTNVPLSERKSADIKERSAEIKRLPKEREAVNPDDPVEIKEELPPEEAKTVSEIQNILKEPGPRSLDPTSVVSREAAKPEINAMMVEPDVKTRMTETNAINDQKILVNHTIPTQPNVSSEIAELKGGAAGEELGRIVSEVFRHPNLLGLPTIEDLADYTATPGSSSFLFNGMTNWAVDKLQRLITGGVTTRLGDTPITKLALSGVNSLTTSLVKRASNGLVHGIEDFYTWASSWVKEKLGDESTNNFTKYIKDAKDQFQILSKYIPKMADIAFTIKKDGYVKMKTLNDVVATSS